MHYFGQDLSSSMCSSGVGVTRGNVEESISDFYTVLCVCISEVSRTAEIAEALQNRLDAYKAEKRELGSVSVHLVWE